MSEDGPEDAPHQGGLILGPRGEDSVLAWFDPRTEQVFTAEQLRLMSEWCNDGD